VTDLYSAKIPEKNRGWLYNVSAVVLFGPHRLHCSDCWPGRPIHIPARPNGFAWPLLQPCDASVSGMPLTHACPPSQCIETTGRACCLSAVSLRFCCITSRHAAASLTQLLSTCSTLASS